VNALHLDFLRGLMSKRMWEANNSVLSDDIFTGIDMKTLYSYLGELHEETVGDLSVEDLRRKVESKYCTKDSSRKDELIEVIDLAERREPLADERIQPLLADYAARQLATQASKYIAGNTDGDSWDLHKAYDFLERAVSLQDHLDLGVEDLMAAPEPTVAGDRPGIVTVGLGSAMDIHLGGGVGNGELLIWLAGYGQGKTSYMINQGVEIAQQGDTVLHISLEISSAKCMQRVDQKLTGLNRDERLAKPGLVMVARKGMAGKFFVKDWSHAKVTVDDIKALVRRMEARGEKVDVICVDYLELMVPVRNNRHGERFNFSQVAKDLRALANELQLPIITAWQVNRSGYEKNVIGAVDVSECWDIVKHADIILGLNQNNAERDERMLRVNIIKQRESTARPIEYYTSDLDRMQIKQTREHGDDDEEPRAVGSGD